MVAAHARQEVCVLDEYLNDSNYTKMPLPSQLGADKMPVCANERSQEDSVVR